MGKNRLLLSCFSLTKIFIKVLLSHSKHLKTKACHENTADRSVVATANRFEIDPNTVISEAIAGIVRCGPLKTQAPAETHFEDDHVHLFGMLVHLSLKSCLERGKLQSGSGDRGCSVYDGVDFHRML